ncbi:pentapeptide repeat-containing protein [Eubacteriales bacterium KG125]
MRGYKAFNKDWTCRNFQYEIGKTFKHDGKLDMCGAGFHFCKNLADCFNYYDFDENETVIAEVEAVGQILESRDDTKCCTDQIKILKEVSWDKVLEICNTGNRNTGDRNTGDCNTGNWNTGDRNTGDCNTGNWNTGNCNTGDRNTGDWNTGNRNTGNWNTGNRNTGNCNTGNWNTGNCNTGNRNTGDWNTGNRNTGDRNTGDWNTGNCNTGNWNTGNRNTGDWNDTDYSDGCFNTSEVNIYFFNKLSNWTKSDWLNSEARYILNRMPTDTIGWCRTSEMTDDEKIKNPSYVTTGGFLKSYLKNHKRQEWWDNLPVKDKKEVINLPNFDKEIFKQITGIEVE